MLQALQLVVLSVVVGALSGWTLASQPGGRDARPLHR
jgi:hypothetical protein